MPMQCEVRRVRPWPERGDGVTQVISRVIDPNSNPTNKGWSVFIYLTGTEGIPRVGDIIPVRKIGPRYFLDHPVG